LIRQADGYVVALVTEKGSFPARYGGRHADA
jgi:hypothetical protein